MTLVTALFFFLLQYYPTTELPAFPALSSLHSPAISLVARPGPFPILFFSPLNINCLTVRLDSPRFAPAPHVSCASAWYLHVTRVYAYYTVSSFEAYAGGFGHHCADCRDSGAVRSLGSITGV